MLWFSTTSVAPVQLASSPTFEAEFFAEKLDDSFEGLSSAQRAFRRSNKSYIRLQRNSHDILSEHNTSDKNPVHNSDLD